MPANPAAAPATTYQPARFIGASLPLSQSVCLMVDGLAGQPQPFGHLDDAAHKPLGPADVDVPPAQVGNQALKRSLVQQGLLPGADQFVQPAVPVPDQLRDLPAQHEVL